MARIDEPIENSEKPQKARQDRRNPAAHQNAVSNGYVNRYVKSHVPQQRVENPAEEDRQTCGEDGYGEASFALRNGKWTENRHCTVP